MENKKVVSSLAFKMAEQFSVKGIGLIISIVLARILSPDDFGQLAILTVFINLSLNLIQSGFGSALVQTKELGKYDYSTAFYINLAISFAMVVILFVLAPLISKFYNSNGLVAPLRFYSISLLFGAFNSIQTAKLQREMKFRASMFARLTATLLSGGIGIALAYFGYGLWALVIYNFSYIVLSSITMFFVCRWLPRFEFSKERAKVLWGFGWKMLVSSFLCSIYADIKSLIIGKKYSTDDLGYYNRGDQFPYIISNTIDTAIQSVMFPVLSKIQDQKEKLRETLKKSISMGSLFIFPVMIGLLVVAKPLTIILLTEKWLPSVPYMQLLCLAHMTISLNSANLTVIKSMGRSDVYMKLEIIRRIIMIAILLVTVFAFNSVMAIVIGYVISLWLDVIIISIPVKKLLGLGAISQFRLIWKIVLSVIIMAVATYFVGLISLPVWLTLIIQIIVGITSYVLCCLLFREKNFLEILGIIKKLFNKKSIKEN
ncbi:MAG: lipopolysaccharide biosynthesis protein [Clostridiales bacterium]|nr:lipopolysaccharide biosynthesis protein [Clostridiales bacterium]